MMYLFFFRADTSACQDLPWNDLLCFYSICDSRYAKYSNFIIAEDVVTRNLQ